MAELLSIENLVVPTHYDINLEINPSKTNFKGFSKITLKKNELSSSTLKRFKLHSKDLIILSATLCDGTEHKLNVSYEEKEEVASFSFSQEISIPADKDLILKLEYLGRIRAIKTFEDETIGVFKTNFMNPKTGKANNFVLATHCQPYYARSIFPCVDEPSLKTTFALSIKTISRFKVISNTAQKSFERVDAGNETLYKFNTTPLMATSLFGFVIGDLDMIKSEVFSKSTNKKIPITIYSSSDIQNAAFTLDTVQKYIPILENYFNKAYPLEKLDLVLLPFLKDMAMENFGLITVQMNHLLLTPTILAENQTRQQVQQLIVHELVHQWMGNYISFESFEYLWFNESFATWCACELLEENGDMSDYWTSDEYLKQQIEHSMASDSDSNTLSITAASLKATMESPSQTKDFFNSHSYLKGIALLRSMSLTIGKNKFKESLQEVFRDDSFYNKSVKPIDIIYYMARSLKSENVSNYFSSWCRTAGLPVISAQLCEENGITTTKLVQHRYLTDKTNDFEDTPYYIPLFIELPDNELDTKHVLMTDRTLKIGYPILLCNHLSQGYYHVSYESELFYDQINNHISDGTLSEVDLNKVLGDIILYIGDIIHQKPIHFVGLQRILTHISSENVNLTVHKKYWPAVKTGLIALRQISLLFKNEGNTFKNYVEDIVSLLMQKIDWPQGKFPLGSYSSVQLDCMAILLFLGRDIPKVVELCHNYLNHIIQGPTKSIPVDIAESVFAVISQNAKNTKQWRKLLELSNSCKTVEKNIDFNNSSISQKAETLQFYVITNMCFSNNAEILKKTLEFISTHLDVRGVDTALTGISYNAKKTLAKSVQGPMVRDIVWEWFTSSLDNWLHTISNKNTSDDRRSSISSIAYRVLRMFADKPDVVEEFLTIQENTYLELLGVRKNWQVAEASWAEENQLNEETAKYELFKN